MPRTLPLPSTNCQVACELCSQDRLLVLVAGRRVDRHLPAPAAVQLHDSHQPLDLCAAVFCSCCAPHTLHGLFTFQSHKSTLFNRNTTLLHLSINFNSDRVRPGNCRHGRYGVEQQQPHGISR